MAENTTPAQISDSDYEAAREAGLLIVTVADEIRAHKFAEAIRRSQWIHTTEKLPQVGQQVLVWVEAERHGEDDDGNLICTDESGVHLGECRRLESPYLDCYSSPFADVEVITHWMPLPGAPK
jgi:hypothetical protein